MAELKAKNEAERERKARARMRSPTFYRLGAWWISVVVTIGIALGTAYLTDRLIAWAVGLFGTHLPNVDSLSIVLAAMGLVWAGSYCIIATAYYADDPERGRKVFYLRGLLGG